MTLTPTVFNISARSRSSGGLNTESLLRLLRLTREQLPEFELWCAIDRETSPLLSELAAQDRVRWELIEHPHSPDARIIELPEDAERR